VENVVAMRGCGVGWGGVGAQILLDFAESCFIHQHLTATASITHVCKCDSAL
jgi:hypothetical protein